MFEVLLVRNSAWKDSPTVARQEGSINTSER